MSTWIIGVNKDGAIGGGVQYEPEAYAMRGILRVLLADEDQTLSDQLDLMLYFSDEPGSEATFLSDCRIVDEADFAQAFRNAHIRAMDMTKEDAANESL